MNGRVLRRSRRRSALGSNTSMFIHPCLRSGPQPQCKRSPADGNFMALRTDFLCSAAILISLRTLASAFHSPVPMIERNEERRAINDHSFAGDAFEEEESSIRDVVSTNGFSMSKPLKKLAESDWTTTRLRASWRAPIPLCYGPQWPLRGGGGQGEGGSGSRGGGAGEGVLGQGRWGRARGVLGQGEVGQGCNRRRKVLNPGSRQKIGLRRKAAIRRAFRVIEPVAVAGASDAHQAPRMPKHAYSTAS